MVKFCSFFALTLLLGVIGSTTQTDTTGSLQDIATDAYLYFYPLVTMDITRRQAASEGNKVNKFNHLLTYPNTTTIVRTNFDTLYSTSWLDLSNGPVLMSLPDTDDRYYVMQIMDMWTDVIGAPGARTTGTKAGDFAITLPGCNGHWPNINAEIIEVPTPYAWIIGRTQTNGPNEYATVNALQTKYKLKQLKGFSCPRVTVPREPDSVKAINFTSAKALLLINSLTARQYFEYSAYLLQIHRPHTTDWSQLSLFKKIGLTPGKPYNWNSLSTEVQSALQFGVTAGLAAIKGQAAFSTLVNGWSMNMGTAGTYGSNYMIRAYTTAVGLGANQPEDAVYPFLVRDSTGNPLNGTKCYRITFPAGGTPPNQAYWSLTLYDILGYQIPNSLSRYAVHSWDDKYDMKYNADGSLTFYIQAQQPTNSVLVGNWLPAATTSIVTITMRVYSPLNSMMNYKPPPAIPSACV